MANVLSWVQDETLGYRSSGVDVRDWSRSWSDGLAFCALMHSSYPDAVGDIAELAAADLKSDADARRRNFALAFGVAQERAGVAPLLDVQDMIDTYPRPDDKSVMAYVAMLHKAMA